MARGATVIVSGPALDPAKAAVQFQRPYAPGFDDGGPAYPTTTDQGKRRIDAFAIAAMQAIIATGQTDAKLIAQQSWAVAQTMIEEMRSLEARR